MVEVRQTESFRDWFAALRDKAAAAIILRRIDRLRAGLLGDARAIGDGISELRIDHGLGYRVDFVRRGSAMILQLCGGDKSSQERDIEAARKLAANL